MKDRERRLTRYMKELLSDRGLNWENWHYIKHYPGELHIVHRTSGKPKVIKI